MGRSSSAAKKADAVFKISFALRSSLFSRRRRFSSSSANSPELPSTPCDGPEGFNQLLSVCAETPTLSPISTAAPHFEHPSSSTSSSARRTALALKSSLYFLGMIPRATLEADENRLMNKHYTKGRNGRKINKVIIHHNAGNLTIKSIWDVWQTRQASAHYQVDSGGRIGQLVWDRDTAWHAGNWEANTTSIGIEHADISSKPWRISEACLDNGAHLVAAICHYYKLGRPVWGKNVFGHKHFSATECPASLAGSQHAAYMARAQYWYDRMSGTKPAPTAPAKPTPPAPKPSVNIDALADAVIRGEYGNGDERKRRLGSNYAAVQKRVNEKLAGGNPTKPSVNIDALADAVIRGDYGNGEERKRRLGGNYAAVQKRVNEKLGIS